jgi:hypothetical protein
VSFLYAVIPVKLLVLKEGILEGRKTFVAYIGALVVVYLVCAELLKRIIHKHLKAVQIS